MADQLILLPFGPTREVPEGYRWCFACDGSGKARYEDDAPCEVCRGKGHWNADDLRAYHKKFPHICKESCGERHREPFIPAPTDPPPRMP